MNKWFITINLFGIIHYVWHTVKKLTKRDNDPLLQRDNDLSLQKDNDPSLQKDNDPSLQKDNNTASLLKLKCFEAKNNITEFKLKYKIENSFITILEFDVPEWYEIVNDLLIDDIYNYLNMVEYFDRKDLKLNNHLYTNKSFYKYAKIIFEKCMKYEKTKIDQFVMYMPVTICDIIYSYIYKKFTFDIDILFYYPGIFLLCYY